jgi:glutathione S-transferase
MAGWKLASNGEAVARFAARGGPKGANNPRKTFGAQLADPYAESDKDVQPYTDAALRAVCKSLIADDYDKALDDMKADLEAAVPSDQAGNVASSLAYLRDRVGVPRDLPLASARHLRAHINYAIQSIV